MIIDQKSKSFRIPKVYREEESLPQRKTAIPFLRGKDVFTSLRHDLLTEGNRDHLKCADGLLSINAISINTAERNKQKSKAENQSDINLKS